VSEKIIVNVGRVIMLARVRADGWPINAGRGLSQIVKMK